MGRKSGRTSLQNVELLCGQKGRGVGREFLPACKWSGGKRSLPILENVIS